jgi:N-acetylglutamate synthase-like GNAT family acetyltransferase
MKIRFADVHDTESIIDMLMDYRQHSPIHLHKSTDNAHARDILAHIFAGLGVVFVAEDADGSLAGMLIAMKNPNVWDPKILMMNELAYWVNPESRGSSAGYKLIKRYQEYATEIKDAGEIQAFTISKMINSPDLKYDRFGFEKIEEMWGVQ